MREKTLKTQPTQPQREPKQEEMQARIAEAAYYRAESRGFEPGGEVGDWLAAEAEIMARMRSGQGVV